MRNISAVFFLLLFASLVDGATYKGQREFVKNCVPCHKGGQSFVADHYTMYWEEMMLNNGKRLANLHLKLEEAKESWEYFESKKFQKNSKHLQDFLLEYAKDSGNVPACN